MADYRNDDQLNSDNEFSLESILNEFGGKAAEDAVKKPEPAKAAPAEEKPEDWEEDTVPFATKTKKNRAAAEKAPSGKKAKPSDPQPEPRGKREKPGEPLPPQKMETEKVPEGKQVLREEPKPRTVEPPPKAQPEKMGVVTAFHGKRVTPAQTPPPKAEVPHKEPGQVLEFPGEAEPENRVAMGLDNLRRKADEFADHMFEEAGAASAPEVKKAEKLIPGVDREEAPPPAREKKPKRQRPSAPDLPPLELSKRYGKGLKGLRNRCALMFVLIVALFYMTLAETMPLPVPVALAKNAVWRCYTLAGLQAGAILLGFDGFVQALGRPFRGRMGLDTLAALSNVMVLLDALTLPTLSVGNINRQPLCAPAALCLWFVLWGGLQKRRGQRLACRTAAAVAEPYLVTRDEGKWNNRDTYTKWSNPPAGFGSQIQGLDGAERIYRIIAPVILVACILFAVMASFGRQRPEDFLWSFGAILCAASPLSATLCFGLPWRKLSARLGKSGAALAGWDGVAAASKGDNLLLTDTDLFPPGAVKLNGVKIFGDVSIDKVIAVTATVIRDSGSGLTKVFYELLHQQGAVYRRGEQFTAYEGGGVSEVIRGELVLVGSASFMVLMDVALPPGLNVKNAVFCAIDGELVGIFALNYHLSGAVPLALDTLIHSRVTPVLATRDFNLIPAMLRQRFKLPVDKLEFPPVERRRELSEENQSHSETLTAVLCREGVGPYAEAVVGARRLRRAVRLSAVLACLGSAVGALLAFYLAFVAAYQSLTSINLTVFLLMWLVPAPLISNWVDRY